jgi:RNase adapter protein RapZ
MADLSSSKPSPVKRAGRKATPEAERGAELVMITGLSGSGKGTALRCLEDLGYYAVDNLPIDLFPVFADLTKSAPHIQRAALVMDVREGEALKRFPKLFAEVSRKNRVRLLYLDAEEEVILRRFSETRRPHPLGRTENVRDAVQRERKLLEPIRKLASDTINTSNWNVHQLRDLIADKFGAESPSGGIAISVMSFGFRYGVPTDADLVFDVRFLPNPNYIPTLKKLTGKHPSVARFVRRYPQTREFLQRCGEMLTFLTPHYIDEGKSYLTIAFGCTGGHHRSVMIAEEMARHLRANGFEPRIQHRDIERA